MEGAPKSSEHPPRDSWAKRYEDNITSMRDAGRWVIGVVAGLLLAATNLSGFGRLYPNEWRFWLAVVSATVSVAAIGGIITLFLQIQVGEELDWQKLTLAQLSFVKEYGFLRQYDSFMEFRECQLSTIGDYSRVRASIGATALVFPEQHNNDLLNQQMELLDKVTEMAWEQREIETLLAWRPTRERFERARRSLLWLGVIASMAALTLVWSVNAPESHPQTVVVMPTMTAP